MSGDAGNKSRRAKRERERASSFSRRLGSTTHRLERTGERVSVRLALRAVQDSVREDAHGRRSRQQVVVPQHHLRLRVHRVHARFGVFLASSSESPFASVDQTRVRLCRLVVRSRYFSAKQTKRRFGLRGSRRASANPTSFFRRRRVGTSGSRVFVADRTAQRRSIRPARSARVVARPPRWVRALGRTAGAAVEAAAAATSRAKATWLRER